MLSPPNAVHIVTGLVVAALLGGLIGLQRLAARKPAGLRTHLLVSVGACAFTQAGLLFGSDRIAAGVLTGVGFLGAGAIVRQGFTPHGLTTAASIWAVAAVGLACGLTHSSGYLIAATTALIVFLALTLSDAPFAKLIVVRRKVEIAVTFDVEKIALPAILAAMPPQVHESAVTDAVSYESSDDGIVSTVGLALVLSNRWNLSDVLEPIAYLPGVRKVEVVDETASS